VKQETFVTIRGSDKSVKVSFTNQRPSYQ